MADDNDSALGQTPNEPNDSPPVDTPTAASTSEWLPEPLLEPIVMSPGRYRLLLWVTVLAPLVVISIAGLFVGWLNFLWMLIAYPVFLATRVRGVPANMWAGVTALYKPAFETGSGLKFIPLGCKLGMMPKSSLQYEWPDEPENVSKRPDDQALAPGEKRTMRILTGDRKEELGDDPLNSRLALEISTINEFELVGNGYFEMDIRIPGDTWEEKLVFVRRRLRDVNETELVEDFALKSSAEIQRELPATNERLKNELQKAVGRFGIRVTMAKVKSPDFPKRLNEELAEIATARGRAQRTVIDAKAEKERTIIDSEGEKEAGINLSVVKTAEILAEGKGVAEAAKAMDMPASDLVAARVVEKAKPAYVLGAEGIAQMMGFGRLLFGGSKKPPQEG